MKLHVRSETQNKQKSKQLNISIALFVCCFFIKRIFMSKSIIIFLYIYALVFLNETFGGSILTFRDVFDICILNLAFIQTYQFVSYS